MLCDIDREAVLRNLKYKHGAGVTREGGRAAGEVLDRVIEDEEEEEQQAKFNDVEDLPALIHDKSAEPEDEPESVMPIHVSQRRTSRATSPPSPLPRQTVPRSMTTSCAQ